MGEVHLVWGAHTDKGLRRATNEDALIADYPLFLVADGMGGHDAGGLASQRALAAFRHLVGQEAVSVDDIEEAFKSAVEKVREISAEHAAGTTISGLAVSEQAGSTYWLVINIGDSRTYRLTQAGLEQISVDHSTVQELIDLGKITESEAELHPQRNYITKAVGAGSRATPDYWLIPARSGDRLLVCSDGLSRELGTNRITAVLRNESSPSDAAIALVHEALLHGGSDNVTVIVIDAHLVLERAGTTGTTTDWSVDTIPIAELAPAIPQLASQTVKTVPAARPSSVEQSIRQQHHESPSNGNL